MSKTKQFTQGTCEFCGELRMVDPCATEEEADQLATEQCGCPGSHAHYPSEAEQEERANKREQVLADTVQDIDELFGGAPVNAARSAFQTMCARYLSSWPPLCTTKSCAA